MNPILITIEMLRFVAAIPLYVASAVFDAMARLCTWAAEQVDVLGRPR